MEEPQDWINGSGEFEDCNYFSEFGVPNDFSNSQPFVNSYELIPNHVDFISLSPPISPLQEIQDIYHPHSLKTPMFHNFNNPSTTNTSSPNFASIPSSTFSTFFTPPSPSMTTSTLIPSSSSSFFPIIQKEPQREYQKDHQKGKQRENHDSHSTFQGTISPPLSDLDLPERPPLEKKTNKKRKATEEEEDSPSSSAVSNSVMVKRRCRTKLDNHLKLLADTVPGAIESICWKKSFRNQILNSALLYIKNLQFTVNHLESVIKINDKEIDRLVGNHQSILVEENVLEQIKKVMHASQTFSKDDPQLKIINQLIGAKAYLLNQFTGKLYFFSGNSYTRFDLRRRKMDAGYPRMIALANWPGVFSHSIDAACHVSNGIVYFFSGNHFIKYDIVNDKTLPGYPMKINNESWPGLSFTKIDACVNWENGKLYFFSGNLYSRYDLNNNCQDPGYPKLISDGWKLLGALFSSGIDAGLSLDGKAYFIKGSQCVRYDLATQIPDHGKITIDEDHPIQKVLDLHHD